MEKQSPAIDRRPEAILFDLGSTLLHDSKSGGLSSRGRTLLSNELFAPYMNNAYDLPTVLANAMDDTYRNGWEEFHVKKWLEDHLIPDEETAQELEKQIRSAVIDYSPPDDAKRVLNELLPLEMPMAVVSNSIFSSDLLWNDIRRLSVPEAFRFVISSAEFGYRKPHTAIFEHAVERLGSRPSETWYVGDLWENDVVGSTNAGLIPVWLNAKEAAPSVSISHIRVKNWTELGEVLQI